MIDNIVRNEEKDGVKVIDYNKVLDEIESDALTRAADWVTQIAPSTDEIGGCCILYSHLCELKKIKKF